ncbi:MAG TPA: hypothetical protein VI792_00660, partial [Candidatus Eisenbacteria bacterium]
MAVLAIGLGLLLETPWGVRTALQAVFALARPLPGATLEIAGARGGFLTGIELRGVRLTSPRPRIEARADTLRLTYRPAELLRRPLRVGSLLLAGPTVSVAVVPRTPPRPRSGRAPFVIDVDQITVRRGDVDAWIGPLVRDARWRATDLALALRDLRWRGLRTTLALDTLGTGLAVPGGPERVLRLSARGVAESDGLHDVRLRVDGERSRLSGRGTLILPWPPGRSLDGTDFALEVDPFAAADLRPFLPGRGDPGDVSLDLRVRGDGSALSARSVLRSTRAGGLALDGRAVPDSGGPRAARVSVRATALDLGAWIGRPPGSLVLEGTVDADLAGPEPGHLTGPVEVALDGSRVSGVRIERARLSGRFDDGLAALRADAAAAGFTLRASGSARPLGTRPSCDLRATLGIPPRLAGGASKSPRPRTLIAGDLEVRLEAEGRALADAAANLGVALRPDPARAPIIGPGRIEATLARGTIRWRGDAAIGGGRLAAAGEIRPESGFTYSIREGTARGIPFAALTGDTTASTLGANFSLQGAGRDPATLRLDARITALQVARGGHRLEADSVGI